MPQAGQPRQSCPAPGPTQLLRPHPGAPASTDSRAERGSPKDQELGGEARPRASARPCTPAAGALPGLRAARCEAPPARQGRDSRPFAPYLRAGPHRPPATTAAGGRERSQRAGPDHAAASVPPLGPRLPPPFRVCRAVSGSLCVWGGGRIPSAAPPPVPEMARQGLSRALVTASWLAEAVQAGRVGAGLRVLDASWYPPKERNARQEFKERHIPGASFFDIEECRDKSSPYDFMLPSESHFADYVGGLGVSNDTHVVVYDGDEVGTFYAPRAWWMFRAFGHKEVSVLNGGFKNWVKEGYPVTAEVTQPTPAVFKARLNKALVKTFEEMVQNVSSLKFQVVDSRPEGRFRGTELDQGNGGGTGTYPQTG